MFKKGSKRNREEEHEGSQERRSRKRATKRQKGYTALEGVSHSSTKPFLWEIEGPHLVIHPNPMADPASLVEI